ncbi:MAG: hypothetical protein QXF12_02710 [Candidatus Aenigmatarchaeota archaeon]
MKNNKNFNINETLEQNKNSIELAFINFLNHIFKISDHLNDNIKMKLGNKILTEFNFNDYFSLGFLLDKVDIYKFKEYDEEIREIKRIIKKYKNKILYVIMEKISIMDEFKPYRNYLEKLMINMKKLDESRKKSRIEKEKLKISKIYKPKIDTSKLGIQGPFKKDTKNVFLRKDPYDRKFSKHKKDYLEESENFREEDVIISNDGISYEKKKELIKDLNFLKMNFDSFSEDFINSIKPIIIKLFRKIKTKNKQKKDFLRDENY